METTRIKELIIKKISGTGSQEDLLELEALLHNFPAYKVLDDVLTNTTAATEGTPGERDVQTQLDTLWQRIDQHKANGRRRIEGRLKDQAHSTNEPKTNQLRMEQNLASVMSISVRQKKWTLVPITQISL